MLVIGGSLAALAITDEGTPATSATDSSPGLAPQGTEADGEPTQKGGAEAPAEPENQTHQEQETRPTETVDWEGRLDTFVCAPSGPYSCSGPQVSSGDDMLDTGLAGNLTRADLSLTWEAQTPASKELGFTLASGHTECDGRCHYFEPLAWVQGTSPLSIEAEDLVTNQGESLWILVDSPDQAPTDLLYGKVELDQPFHVTGTLVPGDPPQEEASA